VKITIRRSLAFARGPLKGGMIPRAMAPRFLTILTGRKPAENPVAERACRCG